ncbi:hypothetical protein ACHHYP_13769 [Achlya hypogyna]|uniref:Uncharacterized protein n=1 Tax=Achlya hypogyna TaxID=1202772 RepID=A0A1V9ZFV4_ACHHY|nr:hypothetical protein ACHHYP_13769 [Achlya hypogyna]
MDAKEEWSYWEMLNQVKIQCDCMLELSTISCDFEQALIGAIKDQFPDARIVGCLFHFKQAIRRKLVALRIPEEQVQRAMEPNVLDVLTVIPRLQIVKRGIPYVKSLLLTDGHVANVAKWASFWKYFYKTWLKTYYISTWNVYDAVERDIDLINHTNNPLEKYNRDFGANFNAAHPNLLTFIQVIKSEAVSYITMLDDIDHGRRRPTRHAITAPPTIPSDFFRFQLPTDDNSVV